MELTKSAKSITSAEMTHMLTDLTMTSNEWVGAIVETNYDFPCERGVVRLADGSILQFAFVSHHLAKDQCSHTVFVGTNYHRNVTGYFCCEVEFGDLKCPKDLKTFDHFLDEIDGSSP